MSGTSSMASKSMSKLTLVPLANVVEKRKSSPLALAASHWDVVKVWVTVASPSVTVKVLSLPLPPDNLIEIES